MKWQRPPPLHEATFRHDGNASLLGGAPIDTVRRWASTSRGPEPRDVGPLGGMGLIVDLIRASAGLRSSGPADTGSHLLPARSASERTRSTSSDLATHLRRVIVRLALVLPLVLAASGGPMAAFGQEGIRLTKEVPATANVLSPVIRTKADSGRPSPRPRMQNSPALAVDPTDSRFVVLANRLDAPDFSCALQVSGNGGAGWVPARPVPKLPKGAEKCYGPEVAFDRSGKLYYLFVGLHTQGNQPMGVFLTTSTDRGRTFSAPRKVLGPIVFQVRLVLDQSRGKNGRLHLVWLQASSDPPLGGLPPTPNPIMAAFSDDGGKTFSRPTRVSDPERARVIAPAVALGADHALHVLYYDLQDDARDYQGLDGPTWEGTWSLVLATSSNAGRTFDAGMVVEEEIVPPERVLLIFTMAPPAVAADHSGRVYAAWHDARNGDWDVFIRASTDGGRTWRGIQRLNDTPEADGRHQYLVRLAVAPEGRLDAIFYDRRGDPENLRADVYSTSSNDGGRRFSPNLKLTSAPSDARIGVKYPVPATGVVEFGSRLGLVSSDYKVSAAWTDTRNSVLAAQQDIFSRQILYSPEKRPSSSGPSAASVAAVGSLVATGILLWRRRTRRTTGQSPDPGRP